MSYLVLGFLTSLSLILAIGPQNIFVIEQGIKRQYIFLICLICSISDMLLIFIGIFLFEYFNNYFNSIIILIFNILLIIFLIYFIYSKFTEKINIVEINKKKENTDRKKIVIKTLGFTFLNPHVYSDTIFFLGNFSKKFYILEKFYFGFGASIASFLFFFSIGYASNYFSKYLNRIEIWKLINLIIIFIMGIITIFVIRDALKFFI